ncbi:hypothetical protein RCL_jg21133.t1 [Rhizophagus clarus]|uniref:Uncharacterized protein n=1 Tax=Rhizophagus clarus TaxID=94130 RepID=A0A8H3QXT9_9GLOM|nr:hypothetical protein RCL_jg21133.t1 [Rhizophagus clarus]
MLTLDDDNSSSTISSTDDIGSFTTKQINNNDKILSFIWNKCVLRKLKITGETMKTESVIMTMFTEEENNYQIEDITNCQFPLVQLVGTWEIDEKTL